jgi:predicted nucleic acid-binding protein
MAGEYYRTLGPGERTRHLLGQVFWIPAYEHMEDYHVVRPGPWDRSQPVTKALFFIDKKTISTIGNSTDLFQHMPIPELKILADEELIVKKVKRRPGVLVIREGVSSRRLANMLTGILPRKPNPDCHVFAPVVSLRKEGNVGRDYPRGFIDKVRASGSVRVFWVDEPLFDKASDFFRKSERSTLSFTDCASFALMKDLSLTDAFAFDSNFREAGFQVYPEAAT